ncbi:hypothetical protein [Spiroplasma citri]|uniref:hypothetical protein n=1 Tax=Spiroplasma citri TaxID=2133 RepID=UPI001EF7549D|nr:hypothetical protein [Spiroplasma citri]
MTGNSRKANFQFVFLLLFEFLRLKRPFLIGSPFSSTSGVVLIFLVPTWIGAVLLAFFWKISAAFSFFFWIFNAFFLLLLKQF